MTAAHFFILYKNRRHSLFLTNKSAQAVQDPLELRTKTVAVGNITDREEHRCST